MPCMVGDCEGEIVDKLTMLCKHHNARIGRRIRESMYRPEPLSPPDPLEPYWK